MIMNKICQWMQANESETMANDESGQNNEEMQMMIMTQDDNILLRVLRGGRLVLDKIMIAS